MQEILIYENIEGLIFDLDGTIADTMPAHFIAWRDTCKKYGIDFTPELFSQLAGIPVHGTVEKLNEMFGSSLDPVKMGQEKEDKFKASIDQVKMIDPVARIIKKYHGIIPMSVGTGSQREIAMETLRRVGMDKYFDILVSADDIEKPKPDPETFLKCAMLMGVAPQKCQVFEDSVLGINAAKDLGMKWVNVTIYYNVTIGQNADD